MKKKYITPQSCVIALSQQQPLLSGSGYDVIINLADDEIISGGGGGGTDLGGSDWNWSQGGIGDGIADR